MRKMYPEGGRTVKQVIYFRWANMDIYDTDMEPTKIRIVITHC